jgi:hypothetical protein
MDIDEKELVYYKTKKAFRDFVKSYQKVEDLEELYYRIDNEEVLAELETARIEVNNARKELVFWILAEEKIKTRE